MVYSLGSSKVLTVQVVPVDLLQCVHFKYCQSSASEQLDPMLLEDLVS